MSDGGRDRASLGVEVWKSYQNVGPERSGVRSIAWLGLFVVRGHQGGYDNIAVAMAAEKSSSLEVICQRLECFSSVNKVHRGAPSGKSVNTEISVEFGAQRQIPLILFPVAALIRRMISLRSAGER